MLWEKYDSLILDLDGVIYIGDQKVPHAIESLNAIADKVRITAVTNNASRHRSEVAQHLTDLGLRIQPEDVVTSSDAAAEYVKTEFPDAKNVLAVGGDGLSKTFEEHGFHVIRAGRTYEEVFEQARMCDLIVEGHGTDTSWWDVTAVIWAIGLGKPWVATNRDLTVPLPNGNSIGNGGFISLIETFTNVSPVTTGKPERRIFDTLIDRLGLSSPLVVGDSFQTDIAGAHNCKIDSLLVLTGVTTRTMVNESALKPTYIAEDLRILLNQKPPEELG
ncbi:MAG: HAD-IIA family hydrolase [Candidatus Nanopelagicales bacterium]